MKKVRRVKRFQIGKSNKVFPKLMDLCRKSTKMYDDTLFVLRQLYFASFPRQQDSQYYIGQIDPGLRPFIESEEKTYRCKKTGESKTYTIYNLAVHSQGNAEHKVSDEKAYYAAFNLIKKESYKSIQATAARSAVKLAYKAMKGYKASFVDWLKNPDKYLGKPKLPNYKKETCLVPYVVDNFKTNKKDRSITINGDVHIPNVYVSDEMDCVKQIRVVYRPTMRVFEVEIIYEKNIPDVTGGDKWMGIDVGINNICAVTTSEGDGFIVSGKPVKSINQFYNKTVADLQNRYETLKVKTGRKRHMLDRKRENKVDTFLHQVSRAIVDYAKTNGIGTIVVGHNNGWKQNIRKDKEHHHLNKKTRQEFVQIPFDKLIQRITYKAEDYGISVIEHHEAYTSKCSALDYEEVSVHETYKGKRGGKHNKDFVSAKKKLINADINGSLNILRLGMGKDKDGEGFSYRTSILTPPKFHKVGREKMRLQNLGSKGRDMAERNSETGIFRKMEATVDSHNSEKSQLEKYNQGDRKCTFEQMVFHLSA